MSDEQHREAIAAAEAKASRLLPEGFRATYNLGKLARGEGEADPEYLAEQAKAPEPTALRMDIEPSTRTLINMQRERRSIE
jgi:hypothetical protein